MNLISSFFSLNYTKIYTFLKENFVWFIVIGLLIFIIILYNKIENRNDIILEKTEEIHKLNLKIQAYKIAEEINLKELEIAKKESKKIIKEIQKIYVPKIEYINEFKKDNNETGCKAAARLLNSFEF